MRVVVAHEQHRATWVDAASFLDPVVAPIVGVREVAAMPEVAEVRGRGFMAGLDLGEHDPSLRLGHRVTVEARERGAIVRPLGDTVVLMPPLAITKADLRRLVAIVAASIRAATAAASPSGEAALPRAA